LQRGLGVVKILGRRPTLGLALGGFFAGSLLEEEIQEATAHAPGSKPDDGYESRKEAKSRATL